MTTPIRWLAAMPLLVCFAATMLIPLLTAWNLAARTSHRPLFDVRRKLIGVTTPQNFPDFEVSRLLSGAYQKDVSAFAGGRVAFRNALVFLNGEMNFSLFGKSPNPNIIADTNGELYERDYLDEYCSRDLSEFAPRAHAWADKLRRLQNHFRAEGKAFIYLITPSKVAVRPDVAERITECKAGRSERNGLLPFYRSILDAHGIRTVDGATLTRKNRDLSDVDLFGRGYTHWNHLGAAPVAREIVEEVNRQLGQPAAPRFAWSFKVRPTHPEAAGDIAGLMNLITPRIAYPSPELTVSTVPNEGSQAACPMRFAAIGGSFLHQIGEVLTRVRCVELVSFHYFRRSVIDYPGFMIRKNDPGPDDYGALQEAQAIILEENEQLVARSEHGPAFYSFMTRTGSTGEGRP